MKGTKLAVIIAALALCAMLVLSVGAADKKLGDVYSTDILATVDGHVIPSYNIGGYTCICMEDLQYYGFDVVWNAETHTITATATDRRTDYAHYAKTERGKGGSIIGATYETNIVAVVNGQSVKSYNIGGYTCVCIEDLGDPTGSVNARYGYSDFCMRAEWDAKEKVIALITCRITPEKENPIILDGQEYGVYYTVHDDYGVFTFGTKRYYRDFRGSVKQMIPIYLETKGGLTGMIVGYGTPQGVSFDLDVLNDLVLRGAGATGDPFDLAYEAEEEDDFETLEFFDLGDSVLLYGRYHYSRDYSVYSLRLFTSDGEVIEYMNDLPYIVAAEPIFPCDDLSVNSARTEVSFTCRCYGKTYHYAIDLTTGEIEAWGR